MKQFDDSIRQDTLEDRGITDDGAGAGVCLTRMQIKILNGVRLGLLNKQIAFDLGISEATVKCHLTLVMRKLNVSNRTQAALFAKDMKLTCYDTIGKYPLQLRGALGGEPLKAAGRGR